MTRTRWGIVVLILFVILVALVYTLVFLEISRQPQITSLTTIQKKTFLPILMGTGQALKGAVYCCSTTCSDINNIGAKWTYKYWPTLPNNMCGIEFIGMFRDPSQFYLIPETLKGNPSKIAIINEPEVEEPAGSGMKLTDVITSVHYLRESIPLTITLIGPQFMEFTGQPYSVEDFLKGYNEKYGGPPKNVIPAFHYYGKESDFGAYADNLRNTYLHYGYPINTEFWLTEFGFSASITGMEEIKRQIKLRPWITRFAYFAPRLEGYDPYYTRLINNNGTLTEMGKFYKEW
jgi:hypothetical protein